MPEKLVTKICLIDQTPFLVKPAHAHKRHHCSRRCMAESYRRAHDAALEERLWSKVWKGAPEACWLWQSQRSLKGYGQISIKCRPHTVTRVIWKLLHGDIPPGLHVLHRCDNPPCCNPAHLFLGTAKDNTQDMLSKGRNSAKTKPEQIASGVRHGSVTHPEQWHTALSHEEEQAIASLYAGGGLTYAKLAERYSVSAQRIARIVRAAKQDAHRAPQQQRLFG
jgi:hypothetical protein